MTISRTQFCVNLLSEFFKPAGYLTPKSQLVTDTNRPLLNIRINQGFKINDTGNLELELIGINYIPGRNLFSQDCFEFNCFQEEGLRDSYINIGTDICLVQTSKDNPYMTPEQRLELGTTCFIDDFNKARYFIRGTSDIFGYVYVADIGIINPISGFFTILDSNVPFYSSNKPGSLFAKSLRKLPVGIKAAIIKRVSVSSQETIGAVFGQLEQEFYFPHSTLKANRSFTYEGQKIKLEDLSINLLLMSSFNRFELKDNQIIYRNINYSSPEIENIITQSGRTFLNLINNFPSSQQGSVPKYITSYLNNESQYNNLADPDYSNLITDCFDVNCFEPGCFERIINNSLIERTIDNRSIAWLIQFLIAYSINYNQNIDNSILTIIRYLRRQKDPKTKLYYKGWDQKEVGCIELTTEDLVELSIENQSNICLEENLSDITTFYNQSLDLNTEILTSTNVAIFMALLKAFEITQNFDYIIEADELYNSINKYLVNDSNLLQHSTLITNTSIESATYQLILNLITEEYQSLTELIAFFKARLFASPLPEPNFIQVGTEDVLVDSERVYITNKELINSDDDNFLFTPTEFDNITTFEDIFKYNYLAYSSFNYLNQKISIPFLATIQNKYNLIENNIINDRSGTSLIFSIGCLINNESFLNFNNIHFNSLLDFNNYRFQKELIFNNMLHNIPKDYNWFNPQALNKSTHIGALLYSYSKSLARTNAEYENIKRSISIEELYGKLLNFKAEDYSLTRFIKESDSLLRTRIKNEIFNRGITKENIVNKLNLFNTEVSIKDNFPAILSFEASNNNLFSNNWGLGYLQGGNTYNTNIVTFNFSQPVESDVYEEIQKMKPAGIKLDIIEVYSFNIAPKIEGGTSVIFTSFNGGCDNLELSTGGDILLESQNKICLEDEETVITEVVLSNPVLPSLNEPIVEDDPNSCDCESLRGYISINNIATELRNLRTIPLTGLYDVNATNGTTEPCDLAIKTFNNNSTLQYLEIFNLPLPTDLINPPTIKGVYYIIDSVETGQLFTFINKSNNQQSTDNIVYREGIGGDISISLPTTNNIDVKQTTNYLLVYDKTNNTFTSINKITLELIVIPFTPEIAVNNYKLINLDSDSIGIYSVSSTDNLIYTSVWFEGNLNITNGNIIPVNESYRAIYFNTNTGLKLLLETTSTNIYSTPDFDELDSIETTLSTNTVPDEIIHHKDKNYFSVVNFNNPFSTHTIYQNNQDIIRLHSNDTVLTTLDYGPPSLDTFTFYNIDKIIPLENYFFLPGSNKAYSFSSNKLEFINDLICTSDSNKIPSGYTIQSIGKYSGGVLVMAVNLITEEWIRLFISIVNKEC